MHNFQITIDTKNREDLVIENYKVITKDLNYLRNKGKDANISQYKLQTFFFEEYSSADEIVTNIAVDNNKQKGRIKESYKIKNNIIIFSGDRGSGKTSAMVSFGKYLENKKDNEDRRIFHLLEMIDPSYFRKNESILLNIITLMFKIAKRYDYSATRIKKDTFVKYNEENQVDAYQIRAEFDTSKKSHYSDLLRNFEKVFRSVKRMDSIMPKEDSLEYLNELSDAIELNFSIYNLVENFLGFFEEEPKYLVLMIDDLDMNVSYAATMLEQIRKFLIHDNIIILFATNMDQLQFEMKESYSKYYDKIIQSSLQRPSISVDVEEMATNYLLKLFPPLQRIHLGNASQKLIKTKLKIDNYINGDLQKVILNLIWRKTRLIYIPENNQLHPIIPTNLRALRQFIYLLLGLDNISYDLNDGRLFNTDYEYSIAQKNFVIFKDYIINVWIPSNVSFEEKKVFENIPKEIGRINKYLIQSINVIASKYKKSILIKEVDLMENEKKKFDRDIYTFVSPNDPKFQLANKISDIYNFPSNNTAGDILLLIDKYKTYFEAANQNNFIEAVKIYYSLLLFKTMFFSNPKYNASFDYPINEQMYCISDIQRLIGGTLFFPHYFDLIRSEEYDHHKRIKKEEAKLRMKLIYVLQKKIEGQHLAMVIKDFLDESSDTPFKNAIENILRKSDNESTIISEITNEIIKFKMPDKPNESKSQPSEDHLFYHRFNLPQKVSSYLSFFIIYYGVSRPERSLGVHLYDTKQTDGQDEGSGNMCRFDILSLLVNSLNPDQTLTRFLYKNNDESSKEELNEIKARISHWKEKSRTLGGCYVQNFILPIYSVDLMLMYLRSKFDATEIDPMFSNKNARMMTTQEMERDVRNAIFISKYYDKLNQLTTMALHKIEFNCEELEVNNEYHNPKADQFTKINISEIYNVIFRDGIECFLLPSRSR